MMPGSGSDILNSFWSKSPPCGPRRRRPPCRRATSRSRRGDWEHGREVVLADDGQLLTIGLALPDRRVSFPCASILRICAWMSTVLPA